MLNVRLDTCVKRYCHSIPNMHSSRPPRIQHMVHLFAARHITHSFHAELIHKESYALSYLLSFFDNFLKLRFPVPKRPDIQCPESQTFAPVLKFPQTPSFITCLSLSRLPSIFISFCYTNKYHIITIYCRFLLSFSNPFDTVIKGDIVYEVNRKSTF